MKRHPRASVLAAALTAVLCFAPATIAHADEPTPTPSPTPAPIFTPPAPIFPAVTAMAKTSYRSAIGGQGMLLGSNLDQVQVIRVGGVNGYTISEFTASSPTQLSFVVPASPTFDAGSFSIELITWQGTIIAAPFNLNYVVTTKVDREMRYAGTAWRKTSNSTYGFFASNDCTNYVSQLLVARGWHQNGKWWNTYRANGQQSAAWSSATNLGKYLASAPSKATKYTWPNRSKVEVGDVIQFNWKWKKSEGDTWDHSAVISKVVTLPDGTKDFYYTAHTWPRLYGGSVTAIRKAYPSLKLRFWHLH